MGAPADTDLKTTYRFNFNSVYKRNDLGNTLIKDNVSYSFNKELKDGRGDNKANLQKYTLSGNLIGTLNIDLDGVETNNWNQTLDFDAVKLIVIENLATEDLPGNDIEFSFKDESGNISAGGRRVIEQPLGAGINSKTLSASGEEGNLQLVAQGNSVPYNLIIIGADKQSSSSSGA